MTNVWKIKIAKKPDSTICKRSSEYQCLYPFIFISHATKLLSKTNYPSCPMKPIFSHLGTECPPTATCLRGQSSYVFAKKKTKHPINSENSSSSWIQNIHYQAPIRAASRSFLHSIAFSIERRRRSVKFPPILQLFNHIILKVRSLPLAFDLLGRLSKAFHQCVSVCFRGLLLKVQSFDVKVEDFRICPKFLWLWFRCFDSRGKQWSIWSWLE